MPETVMNVQARMSPSGKGLAVCGEELYGGGMCTCWSVEVA